MTLLSDVAVMAPSLLGSAVIGSIIIAAGQSAAARRAGLQADPEPEVTADLLGRQLTGW
jgi:hypothetical protein